MFMSMPVFAVAMKSKIVSMSRRHGLVMLTSLLHQVRWRRERRRLVKWFTCGMTMDM